MRVLIVEDEPILAMDLEDIIARDHDAECFLASTVEDSMSRIDSGIDFALLDIHLGPDGQTSLPVARELRRRNIPFCFISSCLSELPPSFGRVPKVAKPFEVRDISRVLTRVGFGS
ncbi:hypothetical protein [Consotaella salsifontis]|uniref:Response regulatory domain-containing protein n=1 Tax=Consotaella salsifontis TaxID=1365950 RepID=A0A1T4LBL9_9HYPH|nr:hypothetical protein [Consotaella salsifontis]SJZ51907.1 hypothetical protein SAMN05428963_101141 [Consotaella salsifontis]